MDIEFDSAKRDETLQNRGLDFADAAKLFNGPIATIQDERFDYGEVRYVSAAYLANRCVVIVWTWRGKNRRIISMRYAHASEEAR